VRPFHWWRTVFFLIPVVSLYTIALGTASLLSTLVDRRGNAGHWCARRWAGLILATTGVRVEVSGLDRLDPSGTYVFAANHQSVYDIPIVFTALPYQLRIIAKESLGRIPFLGWHLRRAGHLLVDRRNPGASILKKMARLVGEGQSLIVFPEGTRSRDGAVGRFKAGPVLLAIEAGVPLVPVTIERSRLVMRKGELMVRPADVRLTVHAPIPTTGAGREQARELAERVRQTVIAGSSDLAAAER
jgi:1-acyl-sn-glycerol-3-phosphate acyltransferase